MPHMRTLKFLIPASLLVASALTIGCSNSGIPNHVASEPAAAASHFIPTSNLVLVANADRTDIGQVVISGTTNLPDGLKMWIEVESPTLAQAF